MNIRYGHTDLHPKLKEHEILDSVWQIHGFFIEICHENEWTGSVIEKKARMGTESKRNSVAISTVVELVAAWTYNRLLILEIRIKTVLSLCHFSWR